MDRFRVAHISAGLAFLIFGLWFGGLSGERRFKGRRHCA